jgi:hypothetical protein
MHYKLNKKNINKEKNNIELEDIERKIYDKDIRRVRHER